MYDHTFPKLANPQIRHHATHKVGCQLGWPLLNGAKKVCALWEQNPRKSSMLALLYYNQILKTQAKYGRFLTFCDPLSLQYGHVSLSHLFYFASVMSGVLFSYASLWRLLFSQLYRALRNLYDKGLVNIKGSTVHAHLAYEKALTVNLQSKVNPLTHT